MKRITSTGRIAVVALLLTWFLGVGLAAQANQFSAACGPETIAPGAIVDVELTR